MILITNKESNVLVAIAEDNYQEENNLGTLSNGYPWIKSTNIAYILDEVNVFQNVTTSEKIIEQKYCYTEEKGFYLNPDYVEPDPTNTFGITDDLYHSIKEQAIAEVQKEVSNETL